MKEHQTVLLTGATGKLGRELARGFSKQGYTLIFPLRQYLDDLIQECNFLGAREVVAIETDLTSDFSSVELQEELLRRSLWPTVLINNARNREYLKMNEEGVCSRDNWMGEFLLDVISPYELTMKMAKSPNTMLKKVINIASIYGIAASNLTLYDNPAQQSPINYGVVKAALIQLTKELAVRLASLRIEVNSVSFGGVSGRVDEAFQQRYAQLCPAGKMLSEKDVFGPVDFLASECSNGMTGHNLVVDGGWTIW